MKSHDFFKLIGRLGLIQLLLLLVLQTALAGSATWNLSPTSGDWFTAANWTPNTVPNGPGDIATFDVSTTTAVSLSADTEVNSLLFDPGASAFTITVSSPFVMTISGNGLTNNSGIMQNLITMATTPGALTSIQFSADATAGNQILITNGAGDHGGLTTFTENATAGSATIVNNATDVNGLGAWTEFFGQASAGSSTIVNNGATAAGGSGGRTYFYDSASAGTGTFISNGGMVSGAGGGLSSFLGNSTAGNGTFTINGGIDGAQYTQVLFSDNTSAGEATFTINDGGRFDLTGSSSAGDATMIATGGPQGGALFLLRDTSTGGTARLKVFENATVDISLHLPPGIAIGSLEGDGQVLLGRQQLTVGTNNLSTTFSGVIQGRGSLAKIGTGSLTLTGINTYSGGTTVRGGRLVVNNMDGSGTGSGAVRVNAGVLAGRGIIAGDVTLGTGSGAGAALAPGKSLRKTGTLTIQNTLTFQVDSAYKFEFKAASGAADKVVANGVTINNGALFSVTDLGSGTLAPGTVITAIDNTAATPIAGTFSNLSDGSTITVGSNTFQANYEGGDANDLTLTVMP